MPRVIGIDPGTVSIDVCGLDDGRVFLDRSFSTGDALADPAAFIALLDQAGPLDLVAGPSGYGLPLTRVQDAAEIDLRLAFLAGEGEAGGIGGLRSLIRALARTSLPVVLTPGVIHLTSVPAFRKLNRVDMGTADKVCAAALAIHAQAASFILVECGGAFTAALAVEDGRIVDGIGGTSGPIGMRSAGAWDGEVAFLAGGVTKEMLFRGGVSTAPDETTGWAAFVEGAAKVVAALTVSAPRAREVILSGRHAARVREAIATRLDRPVTMASGFARIAKEGAQGAAIIADGLAGGSSSALVETLGIRAARGTVLDYLQVITPSAARARLGIPS